jgi:hypothetical protein
LGDLSGPRTIHEEEGVSEIGKRYGKWTVLADLGRRDGHELVLVRCDCDRTFTRRLEHLQTGASRSCRTCGNPRARHRRTRTPEHIAWRSLLQRCENPKNPQYRNYGGRGITVCAAWRASFEAFFADMGERPSANHSIDRINNDGHYEPTNCRWATEDEQRANRRWSGRRKAGPA